MKIGIDFDEVIADSFNCILDLINSRTGKSHKKEEFSDYNWNNVFGISREECINLVDEFHENHNIMDIKPIDRCVESINYLLKEKCKLHIITARPEKYRQKTNDWVKHYFNNEINIIHSGSYYNLGNKADICKKLEIELMLEDSGETAFECAKNDIYAILFDKPWNKNHRHEKIVRVYDWDEALKEIDKLRQNER